jgi:methyl-accepting chemotaxis protein
MAIAANIREVNRGAGETGAASSQVLAAARPLLAEGNSLGAEVGKFLATVRARVI